MTEDYIERRLNWQDDDKHCRGEESDILRQQCPVVVLGEPGMGKTERWLTASGQTSPNDSRLIRTATPRD